MGADAPGGATTSAGGTCVRCHQGALEVIVWKHAICWQTPEGQGLDATDPPFENVPVRIEGSVDPLDTSDSSLNGPVRQTVQTGSDGKATFSGLREGAYTIYAEMSGYEEVNDDVLDEFGRQSVAAPQNVKLRTAVQVEAGKTSYADIVLRYKKYRYNQNGTWSQGRECLRRHDVRHGGAGGGESLAGMFWSHEPSDLITRDTAWIVLMTLPLMLIAAAAVFLGGVGFWNLYCIGFCAALWSYLTGMIFGKGPGTAAIIATFAAYAALAIALIFILAFAHPGDLDLFLTLLFFSLATGLWTAFGIGYLAGKQEPYEGKPAWWRSKMALITVLAGVAVALVLFLVSALLVKYASCLDPSCPPAQLSLSLGMVIAGLVVILLLWLMVGWLPGLSGHAFQNEGQVTEWGQTDYKLPFLGERYCLQGARGYWTHYCSQTQEGCYDFSLPDRTEVLCAKEGHVISAYSDDVYKFYRPLQHAEDDVHPDPGTVPYGDRPANYAIVRHQDGSAAKYARLMTHGAAIPQDQEQTAVATRRQEACGSGASETVDVMIREAAENPLHVRDGHIVGYAGWNDYAQPEPEPQLPDAPKWGWFVAGLAFAAACLAFVLIMGYTTWRTLPPALPGKFPFWNGAVNGYCPAVADVKSLLASCGYSQDLATTPPPGSSSCAPAPPTPSSTPSAGLTADQCTAVLAMAQSCAGARNNGKESTPCADDNLVIKGLFADSEPFDSQYCEKLTGSFPQQPAAFWTTLGFVVLGSIFLGLFAAGGPNGKPFNNRITTTSFYPIVLSAILLWNGPGSMFFHGTMRSEASWLDSWGMDLFGSFIIAYNFTRIFNWAKGWFILLGCILLVFSVPGAMGLFDPIGPDKFFAAYVGAAFLTEIFTLYSCHISTDTAGITWFWTGMVVFLVAMMIWYLGHTGGLFCQPGGWGSPTASWGHPTWHIMGAFAMFSFSMYFRYQKSPEPCYPRLHFAVLEAPPAGPPVSEPEPQLAPGATRPPNDRVLTVKFSDSDTGRDSNQPRSFRKYRSDSTSLGLPPLPANALFRPQGGGTHPVEMQ